MPQSPHGSLYKILSALCFVVLSTLLILFAYLWVSTPTFQDVRHAALGSDRVLLDREGHTLQILRTDFTKRRLAWLSLQEFPDHLIETLLLSEDQRFRSHRGVDLLALGRALLVNLKGTRGRIEGASTLTMQTADLIQPQVMAGEAKITKGRWLSKLRQIQGALGLEMRWSKDQILEAYLNLIHLKGEHQGVPALTYAYWGKAPLGLTPAESTTLVAMISAPNQRSAKLLEKACAMAQRLGTSDCRPVEDRVSSLFAGSPQLPALVGSAPHVARRLAKEMSDLTILPSTLSGSLQKEVQAILDKNIARLKGFRVEDSAAIIIDNETGDVLAAVGAVSTSRSPHVDGVQSYRQAGSALKPFLYAKGIELKRLTASSIFLDEPTALSWGNQVYRPTNYDRQFFGPVTLRESLGSSLNVPAVKAVLAIGLHQSYQVLQDLQFTGLKQPDFYGVSMALGAVEVRLDELANAYRMLANGGKWSPLIWQRNQDHHSETSQSHKTQTLLSPETAFIVSDILADPNARTIGFGWDSPLETPFWTAVKTGTSKDYRDNWCIGFSRRYTVGVWAGNFDATAMEKVSGVSGAGPAWFEIMSHLHQSLESRSPEPPAGIARKRIRPAWASQLKEEFYIQGTEPSIEVIEADLAKRVNFVFPAEGSVLVKNPHLAADQSAIFVRFAGSIPEGSEIWLNKTKLGRAQSPFKIPVPPSGTHRLDLRGPDGAILTQVQFRVRGN